MNTFDVYPNKDYGTGPSRENAFEPVARIVVIGIGGAGNNAVNRMIDDGVKGVEFVGVNTDAQDLRHCRAAKRVTIGEKVTGGRGCGAIPEIGESAANESKEAIRSLLRETETQKKADMVFITCGMGGGTGTGAAPIVASIAKEEGILTVAVITKPFRFEGKARMNRALAGIDKLFPNVDTMIAISNDKLLDVVDVKDGFKEAFAKADEILKQSIRGITDLINLPALVNLDFADVATVMRGKGLAHIAIGEGSGENKVSQALKKAMESPLLDTKIDGATDLIVSICGEVSLIDVDTAMKEIEPKLSPDVNIIFGAREDTNLKDAATVTVIATGIQNSSSPYSLYNKVPNYSYDGYNQKQYAQGFPKMDFMQQQTNQSQPLNIEKEDISSLFFNSKKPQNTSQAIEPSLTGVNGVSASTDNLNVDLSKVGFTKKANASKDLLPSFITDNLKKK